MIFEDPPPRTYRDLKILIVSTQSRKMSKTLAGFVVIVDALLRGTQHIVVWYSEGWGGDVRSQSSHLVRLVARATSGRVTLGSHVP